MKLLNEPLFQAIFNTSLARAILKANAPDFTIIATNEAHKIITHTSEKAFVGKSVWEVFKPQDAGENGGIILMNALLKAIETNTAVSMPPFRYDIPSANGKKIEENWWQVEIIPVGTSATGKAEYLLLNNKNITARIVTRQKIDEGLKREQLLNEELAAYNEELTVSNEELIQSQAELRELNIELEQRVARRTMALANSEARFRSLVQQAPVGIAIYSGPGFVIELANSKALEIWGHTETVIGKPLLTGRPELEGHPYIQVITDIYKSGQAHSAFEVKGGVLRSGAIKDGYFDVIYQPLKNNEGAVTGIIAVLADITEKVEARKAIERAEEMTRLAVEAAELGTWYIDAATDTFVPSPRLKELFGYYPDEAMPYTAFTAQIAVAYRTEVIAAIEEASAGGKGYSLEYPLTTCHNQQLRWVKATGRLYNTGPGKAAYLSGTMIDITERRQHDQRKNDFISMVSHELKTPLTSIKAYVQVLQARAARDDDRFRINILYKTEVQINKMHSMINGFLNVAALESGKMQLVKNPFNLDDIIQEMVDDAMVSNPRFVFNFLTCEPLPVVADKDKIGQVITNLLSNAVKYSPDGGEVTITCHIENNAAHVCVKDKGIGIRKEDLPNLFERFYRVQSDAMKSFSGFGIGLYLCAEIIERHGGKIWAESEEGKGSVFYFSLPLEEE